MNQTSLVGRPLHSLTKAVVAFAEKRGVWSGPLTSSSPELARLWGGTPTSTGIDVNEMTALTYSTVWACVNNISTDVASLPLILYKTLPNGGKQKLTDHKLYRILHDEPNPEMSSMTFRGLVQAHVLTWGNGYAEIVRDGAGRPAALWPLTPNRVEVKRDARGLYYLIDAKQRLEPENVLHIQGLGFEGSMGYNLTAKARESIALGLATERFGGTFFGNGATFGGVFEHPGRMSEQALKNFRDSVNTQHQGVDRAHKFLITEEGMKYQKLGVDPDHAQFLETRDKQIEEICRFYRMPPHKVQHLIRTSYNSIEHQGIEYYSDTLRPWCVRWEQEIKRKLIAPSERMIQHAEHKIEGVLRGDLSSRYAAYAVGRQWGWLSANRICELENMDPLPAGGDVFLVPMNMSPADRLNEIIDKQVEPAPEPVAPPAPAPKAEDDTAGRAIAAMTDQIKALTEQAEKLTARALEAEGSLVAGALDEAIGAREQAAEALARVQALTLLKDEAERDRALIAEERETERQAADDLRAQVEAAHAGTEAAKVVWAEEAAKAAHLQALVEAERAAKEQAVADAVKAAEDLTALLAERDVLAVEKASLESERAVLMAEQDAKVAELQAAIYEREAQAERDRAVMAQTAAAADLALTDLRSQLQAADQLLAETSSNVLTERSAVEAARAQVAQLEATIAETQAEITRLAAERAEQALEATTAAQAAEEAHRATVAATAQLAQATADAEAARQQLAAETARVEAERAAREQAEAEAEALRAAAEQAREVVRAAQAEVSATAATAELARTEATAARLKVEQEIANAEAARAAKAAVEAQAQAQRQAHADRLQALLPARRDLTISLMSKTWVRVDADRARRNQGTPTKLKAWSEAYYLQREDQLIESLRAHMREHLVFIASAEDVDAYTRKLIAPYLLDAVQQIRTIADGDPEDYNASLERLLMKWETDRPTAIADRIFHEEMTYVRSL